MRAILLTLGFLTAWASGAYAQPVWTPLDGRLFVNVNGLAQRTTQDLTQNLTSTVYSEQARIDLLQSVTTGGMLDVTVGARLWRNLGASLAFSSVSSAGEASASGQVPHPLFFNQPRSLADGATDLGHTQRAVHLQAMWMHRVRQVQGLEIAVSGGPSFFRVTQVLAEGIRFSELGPPFSSIRVDEVITGEHRATPTGGNIGIDLTYLITPNVGAGAFWRYASATAEFALSTGVVMPLDVGGSQIGGGLRLRF